MNNYIIIYDGTFINLLTTIKYLLKNNIKPQNIISENNYTPNLLETILKPNIVNDPNFITTIINTSSKDIFKIITYVYLSNNQNKELILYYFILNTFIYHDKVIYHRNLKCVNYNPPQATGLDKVSTKFFRYLIHHLLRMQLNIFYFLDF